MAERWSKNTRRQTILTVNCITWLTWIRKLQQNLPNCIQGESSQTWFHRAQPKPVKQYNFSHRHKTKAYKVFHRFRGAICVKYVWKIREEIPNSVHIEINGACSVLTCLIIRSNYVFKRSLLPSEGTWSCRCQKNILLQLKRALEVWERKSERKTTLIKSRQKFHIFSTN